MTTTILMTVLSHLSDIQETANLTKEDQNKMNFAKWLLLHNRDTKQHIRPNEAWDLFKTTAIFIS